MSQDALYTTAQAARLTGVSKPAIRSHAARYRTFLSAEAQPEPGQERHFTHADLRLFAFVAERTRAKEKHAEVLARLASGELDAFSWEPAQAGAAASVPVEPAEGAEGASSALMALAQVQALQALLADAQRREQDALLRAQALQDAAAEARALQARLDESRTQEQDARAKAQALQEKVDALTRELGEAKGELDARKSRRPAWLRRLIGE